MRQKAEKDDRLSLRDVGAPPCGRPHLYRADTWVRPYLIFTFLIWFIFLPMRLFAADSLENVLGRIPAQHGGRVKPFASFAKENVLFVTGKAAFERQDPTTLVWHWIAEPEIWSAKPILPVTHLELRKYFSSDLVRNRVSPVLVLNDLEFKKLVSQAQMRQEKKEKVTQLETKQMELYHRARLFEEIANGRMPGFVPHPNDLKIPWLPLEAFRGEQGIGIASQLYPRGEVEQVASALNLLLSR